MKRIIALLLVIFILCGLAACAPAESSDIQFEKIEKIGSVNGYTTWLVYDVNTKVVYIVSGESFCPYYDAEGNVAIYKGRGY